MKPQVATAEDWMRFLRPLVAAVRNPPTQEDMRARCVALAVGLSVPVHMLTDWRQREAMRRFDFWPAIKDVSDWLAPDLADERQLAILRERNLAPPNDLPVLEAKKPGPRPMAEILAARDTARKAVAEMTGGSPQTGPKDVKPAYLSRGQLAASYAALAKEGNAVAATRLAALKEPTDG